MKKSIYFTTILVMMSVLGLVASDIFLPALPSMINYFGISNNQGQQLLSYFLFGISFMQLFYGPISDSIGRRKLSLFGIFLFAVTSFLIVLIKDFNTILGLRVLQAIGACAGITIGRAIISDVFSKEDAAKFFLTIFPIVGMSPAIAPLIGGQLNNLFGWKSCFIFTAIFGIILLFLIYYKLPETLSKENKKNITLSQVFKNYKELLGSSIFMHYAIIPCLAYAAYFLYIAESPFILLQQGVPASYLGYTYISLSLFYVLGNLYAKHLMKKGYNIDKLLNIGYLFFFIGGITFFISTLVNESSFVSTVSSISILTFGNGFLLPLGTSAAVTCKPQLSGSASGLMGALQLGSAAVVTKIIGPLSNHSIPKLGIILISLVLSGFLLHHLYQVQKKHKLSHSNN